MNRRFGTDARYRFGTMPAPSPETEQRNFRPPNNADGTFLLIEDTAYFVFVGYTLVPCTPKYVELFLTTVGTGAQTAEVGFFSTPLPPNKSSQVVTKIVATDTVDTLTATVAPKRNTNAFSTVIPPGTCLWAGIRTAMGTNEPTLRGLNSDWRGGYCLSTATAGALTGSGPWTGAIETESITNGPFLRGVLD